MAIIDNGKPKQRVRKKEDIFISQRMLRIKGQLFLAIILLKVIWNQEIKQ